VCRLVLCLQEERRVAWLHEEIQRLSAYEKDCQNKDEIIGQLYREIDALQRRQLTHTHHELSDAPRMSVLENELIAKAQEIDQLKYQVFLSYLYSRMVNTCVLISVDIGFFVSVGINNIKYGSHNF